MHRLHLSQTVDVRTKRTQERVLTGVFVRVFVTHEDREMSLSLLNKVSIAFTPLRWLMLARNVRTVRTRGNTHEDRETPLS